MMEIRNFDQFPDIQGTLFSVNWGHHFSQHKKAPEHTDLVVYPGGIWKYMETSADIRGRFFQFHRKVRPVKLKTLREDAHCGVQCRCRKRPPQARECAKTHSLLFHRKHRPVKLKQQLKQQEGEHLWQ